MRQSIRLGTFLGIPVGVNWSVLVILALFAWNLADDVLPVRSGRPSAADWIAGTIGAMILLASLLAHEVSHSLVARRNGVGVRSITLFVFGGVAQLEGEAHTPEADFRIAAIGPLTSILLAGFFAAAQAVLVSVGGHGLPVKTLSWLWEVNLLLAIFNLMPAAPLDGGRILRAGLWRHWHDQVRASIAATRAGRVFAILLIALGVLAFFSEGPTGLWAALIGFFLYSAASGEERYAELQGALAKLSVGQVMTPNPPTAPSGTTVDVAITHCLLQYRGDVVVVTGENGSLAGLVTAETIRAVPAERRSSSVLAELAIPLDRVPVARPEEPMNVVFERMTANGGSPAVVLDANGRLAGVVSPVDLRRAALRLHHR